MRTKIMGWFKMMSALATLGLLAACAANAQAPSGPLGPPPGTPVAAAPAAAPPVPLPPPRTTILGVWKFNKEDSDDPADRERSQDSGGYNGRTRVGGPFPGGGGGGPYGGGRRGGESEEQRERMQTMLRPARTMTLSMAGGEVDLVDEAEHKLEFMTDGRKIQKSKDGNVEEIAAKFDGNRLVTDEKDPRGNKMSRTYELSEDGQQLYESIHLMNNKGNTTRTIRYVYDMPLPTGPRP